MKESVNDMMQRRKIKNNTYSTAEGGSSDSGEGRITTLPENSNDQTDGTGSDTYGAAPLSIQLFAQIRMFVMSLYPLGATFLLPGSLLVLLCIIAMTSFITTHPTNSNINKDPSTTITLARAQSKSSISSPSKEIVDKKNLSLQQFEHCTTSVPPLENLKEQQQFESSSSSPSVGVTRNPLWFPGYPSSIDDNVVREIIKGLTGMPAGAKSYYASSNTVKRCMLTSGEKDTAACMVVHPIVELTPGPDAKKDLFAHQFVLLMRNPRTLFAAHENWKRIMYHHKEGQTPVNEWRNFRDQYVRGMMEKWKSMIRVWKETKYYELGMYLAHEHIMDPQRGPSELSRLAALLNGEGFETATEKTHDMGCIWYRAIGKDALEQYQNFGYEYSEHLPSYTKEQYEYLISELSALIDQKSSTDTELATLLKEYREDIKLHSNHPDIAWVNETLK